jgi:hypothetical protein
MDRRSQVQHTGAGRHLGKCETQKEQNECIGTSYEGARRVHHSL